MTSRLALALAAALLSTPALASDAHDDTTYPDRPATWSGSVATSTDGAVGQGDVVYPGPHAAISKGAPPAAERWLATADDTTYPAADPASGAAGPSERRRERADERLACGCARR